jgi:hypothetical protein
MSANVIESRSALAPSGSAPQLNERTALVSRASRWRKFAVKVPWLMAPTVIAGFVGVAALRIYAPTQMFGPMTPISRRTTPPLPLASPAKLSR